MPSKKFSLLVLPLVATLSLQANDPFFNDPFGDNIFKEMMQMQQDMDKMFNRMHQRMQQRSSNLVSPLGTYKIAKQEQFVDKGNHYEYITNIPENKENQIDINAKDGVMAITAKIIEKHENKTANSYSSSSSMRMYQQSIPLPSDVDEGTMSAEYLQGKLVISVKKKKMSSSGTHINITTPAKSTNTIEKIDENKTKVNEQNSSKKMKIDSDFTSVS